MHKIITVVPGNHSEDGEPVLACFTPRLAILPGEKAAACRAAVKAHREAIAAECGQGVASRLTVLVDFCRAMNADAPSAPKVGDTYGAVAG